MSLTDTPLEDSEKMAELDFFTEGKETIKKHLKKGHLVDAAKAVEKLLHDVENIPLNIAVTGELGSGKSTFINRMRGLKDEEEGSAPTGVVDTTKELTAYSHPHQKNVTYWDLPGIGSKDFRASDYLQKVKFDTYDFFIIIASVRFRECHTVLAQEIRARNKNFYFVRTKIDHDIADSKDLRPNGFDEEKVLHTIRQECINSLEDVDHPNVFLIACRGQNKYDFGNLLKTLKDNLDKEKRYAFLRNLPNISAEALEMKKNALRSILPWSALNVGLRCVIPGVSHFTEASRVSEYIKNFLISFGLDNKSLNDLATACGKDVSELKNEMKSPFVKHEAITEDLVIEELRKLKGTGYMQAKYALSWVPGLSLLVAGPMSAVAVYELLSTALDDIADDGKKALLQSFHGSQL